jgi:transcription elongation factor GreB
MREDIFSAELKSSSPMSKAFTKETDDENETEKPDNIPDNIKNYVTPTGLLTLQNEYKTLLYGERPKIVEVVRWAAGNGDRSENGDYIYGKKRLREIDRRLRYLKKRMASAIMVDPGLQQKLTKVFFGATVTFSQKDGEEKTLTLVGIDEADLDKHKISWTSPVATALLKSSVGDIVKFQTPQGSDELTILKIIYKI